MKVKIRIDPQLALWNTHIERSRSVVLRWAFAASMAAAGFAYVLAHLGPNAAVAG